ncbi:MAG TPA: hypothetical protein PKH77_05020 [Anaerolineae bacterium]|nr:hypothetical protein [Anaerolineae bacterium]
MPTFQIDIQYVGSLHYSLRNQRSVRLSKDCVEFKFSEAGYSKLQQAIDKGWVYISGKAEEIVATAYYVWCVSQERPFVKVSKQWSETCQCELDTYTTSYNLSEEGLIAIDSLFRRIAQVQGKAKGKVIMDVGDWSVCNYIPLDKAEDVALALLEIANTQRLAVYAS